MCWLWPRQSFGSEWAGGWVGAVVLLVALVLYALQRKRRCGGSVYGGVRGGCGVGEVPPFPSTLQFVL